MRITRMRRWLVAVLAGVCLMLGGAAACDHDGPGVPGSGEQGDRDGFGNGGDNGAAGHTGVPGEGGAGDEIGGGG